MKWLCLILLIASTQAILLKIHSHDMAPIMFLQEGSSVTLNARSTDGSKFVVYLTSLEDWDQCAHSGFDLEVCKYLVGTLHEVTSSINVHYIPRGFDSVLVVRSENFLLDMELEYSYTYNSPEENSFVGVIVAIIAMCVLCSPLVIVFALGCVGTTIMFLLVKSCQQNKSPVYTQSMPMQVLPM